MPDSQNNRASDCVGYLSDFSPQDKPWDTHKATNGVVSDTYKLLGYQKHYTKTSKCARWLIFALREVEEAEQGNKPKEILKLLFANFCGNRHCPVCQWRRSMRWRAKFFQMIPRLREDYPDHEFLFLTLTVRNCSVTELRETLKWMNEAWQRMAQRKSFPAVGWVKSIEVTRGVDGSAHPHFHTVLMVKPSYFQGKNYLSKQKWWKLWQSCLRVDYEPSIHVGSIKSTYSKFKSKKVENEIAKGLCETLKYSVKEQDLISDPSWLGHITEQLHGTKAVSVGGLFKKYLPQRKLEKYSDDDLIHTSDEAKEAKTLDDDPKYRFSWNQEVKRYKCTRYDPST
jgi:plasmid rolling circle replication initiator protein Rep